MELLVRTGRRPAPIGEIADGQSAARRRALFLDRDSAQRPARNLAAKAARELREPRLDQELVRHGRRPRGLRKLLAVVPDVPRLRRERAEEAGADAAERDPVVPAIAALRGALRIRGSVAHLLVVEIEADLVAR